MEPRPEAGLPATLGRWVGEIVLSIPQPARRTVAELIVGGLLAGGGHVTQAFLALTPRLGWQAYPWMLERGRFRLLGLVAALCGIVRREGHGGRCFAIIDDTLAPRASAKAPGAAVRFDHAHKRNRPAFLLCQAFVTLGTVVACRDRPRCVPIVTGLCRGPGHAGKIALAKALLRAVGDRLGPLCLLLDAWYMRASLIQAALRRGHAVVGQVRRDTALFGLPPPCAPGRRGRPRVYGERIDAAAAALLPAATHRIAGYGGRGAPRRRLGRPGSPSAPRRVSSAVPARRRRPGGLVRVGKAPGRLGEAAPAALHGPGPVRAGGGRGLRAALGGGAPIRRAQADGRHGRDVAAGPQNAPALAAPGPDRPRTACPTDRAGGAGGARASAGRWLAQAGDADAGPGQGRASPPVPRYPGFPPRAHNPQENRPCSWSRPARERRRRMTSGSNPTSTALQEP